MAESSSSSASATDATQSRAAARSQREQWEEVVANDLRQMTAYERIEMDQDVRGKNRLAACAPQFTLSLALKNIQRELRTRRRELEMNTAASSSSESGSYDSSAALATDAMHRLILNQREVVENTDILVRFVRADRLDATKAANRLLEYYSMVVDLFGEVALRRARILLDDLDLQQKKILESGWIQLLLARDKVGRRILTLDEAGPPNREQSSSNEVIDKIKVLMYVFQAASIDSETQKQGLHLIVHRLFNNDGSSSVKNHVEDAWTSNASNDHERRMIRRFFSCTPVRCSTIHMNVPSPETFDLVVPSTIDIFGREERGRIRFHKGTIPECHAELATYGIPIVWMPMTSTGRRKLTEHKQWIKIQKARETAMRQGRGFAIVECPRPYDILLTKTRRASSHPGNQLLRRILEERYEERYTAHPTEKQCITAQVADSLERDYSCRFLVKNNENCWVLAHRSAVIDKLSNSFRFVPRLKPKAK